MPGPCRARCCRGGVCRRDALGLELCLPPPGSRAPPPRRFALEQLFCATSGRVTRGSASSGAGASVACRAQCSVRAVGALAVVPRDTCTRALQRSSSSSRKDGSTRRVQGAWRRRTGQVVPVCKKASVRRWRAPARRAPSMHTHPPSDGTRTSKQPGGSPKHSRALRLRQRPELLPVRARLVGRRLRLASVKDEAAALLELARSLPPVLADAAHREQREDGRMLPPPRLQRVLRYVPHDIVRQVRRARMLAWRQ